MIPIVLQPEPHDFDVKVRRQGQKFLRKHSKPTNKQFRNNNYWNKCLPKLIAAYHCVCAYSACWIPTQATVDHFSPKSVRPELAYEWDNFRLASEKLNNYKRDIHDR